MQTISNLFEHEMRKLLAEQLEEFREGIASGGAQSFDDYRFQAGRIAGLRWAIDLCEQVASDIAKR